LPPFFAYLLGGGPLGGDAGAWFDQVVDQARDAEAAGFDAVLAIDHLHVGEAAAEDKPVLEAYALLAAIAMSTGRVGLGALVTGVTYRNPALLAKAVTTLDVISRGRALLGVGAGWLESEHVAYGYEFPPIGERMDRLDEALTICRLMFTEDRPAFQGRHHRVCGPRNNPRPVQPGGPKILVGGGGEKRTLRIAARHADMTHWFGPMDVLRHKNEVLLRHCEAESRDPSTITRVVSLPVVLVERESDGPAAMDRLPPFLRGTARPRTPEQAAEVVDHHLREGFSGFVVASTSLPGPDSIGLAGRLIGLVGD
jgi:F420-dependent oxidoreductase-like protein